MDGLLSTIARRTIVLGCIVAMMAGCRSGVINGDAPCQQPRAEQEAQPDQCPPQPQGAPEVAESSCTPVSAACYEDALTGGHVFQMYCAACHNARALGERPFASYENAAAHMRVRANLTGEEYRKLIAFLRYWHDIPPQNPPVEPSPKRLIFSQPINELRQQQLPKPQP